jgi:hypothetical protein
MSDATLMGLPKEIQDKIVGVDDPKCLGNRVLYKFRGLNRACAQQYHVKVYEFGFKRMEKVVENDKAEADYRRRFARAVPGSPLSIYDESKCDIYDLNFENFQEMKRLYERALEEKAFYECMNLICAYSRLALLNEMSLKRRYPFNPDRVSADVGMRQHRLDGTVVDTFFRTPDNVRAQQPVPAWKEAPPVAPMELPSP